MKILTLFLSLSLAPVFSAPVLAQEPPLKKVIESEDGLRLVFENVVRTAYLSIHGSLDGFNTSSVSTESLAVADKEFGDLSPWIAYSHQFSSKLGVVKLMNEKGRVYHVWAGLLRDKRMAKMILTNHYAG